MKPLYLEYFIKMKELHSQKQIGKCEGVLQRTKEIMNKCFNFYLLNHLNIPKNSVPEQPRTSDGKE